MERIKTAIIGCGRDANNLHAPILLKHPEFEVIGTFDIRPEASEAMAAMFRDAGHNCKAYETREELLASDVEYCVVLTDSHVHTEVCAACLRAGKHVLVTKPWAVGMEDAEFIIQEAKEAKKKFGVELMVFLPQNWGTNLSTIKEIIKSGDIGQVYQIRRRASTFGKRYDWQIYKKYGGGYLYNWGPHLLGQVLDLVDEPIVKVCAEKKQVIMDGDCEDMFYAIMKTKSGIIINCEHGIMVDKLPHWTVQGSKGTIFVTDDVIDVHKISHPGPIDPQVYRNPVHDDNETYKLPGVYNGDRFAIYTHIADVIHGECPYRIPLTFPRNLTLLLDAIHLSADTDEIVRISEEEWNKPL